MQRGEINETQSSFLPDECFDGSVEVVSLDEPPSVALGKHREKSTSLQPMTAERDGDGERATHRQTDRQTEMKARY
jgi:hypothetical protein